MTLQQYLQYCVWKLDICAMQCVKVSGGGVEWEGGSNRNFQVSSLAVHAGLSDFRCKACINPGVLEGNPSPVEVALYTGIPDAKRLGLISLMWQFMQGHVGARRPLTTVMWR